MRAGVRLTIPSRMCRLPGPCIVRQRMRRALLHLPKDRVSNGLLVSAQARVPKAELLDAHGCQVSGPLRVMSSLLGMPVSTAIEFDGEAGFTAVEIQVVDADRMSATKLVGAEPPLTQPAPHEFLGPRRFLAQGASSVDVGHGVTVAKGCGGGQNGLKVRPHPSPLPRGRMFAVRREGQRSESSTARCIHCLPESRSPPDPTRNATGPRQRFPLLGERARVRAGVLPACPKPQVDAGPPQAFYL